MNKYADLINVLKSLKEDVQKNEKTIYTEEDIEFLKEAYNNKELTILDLTYEEAMLLGISSTLYRMVQRAIYHDKEYSNKYVKEINEKKFNQEPTPRVILEMYKKSKQKLK